MLSKKCLVIAAVLAFCGVPVMAAITNTAHDLSSASDATIQGNNDQLCVYCHTPHGGATGGVAPLWNRASPGAITAVYNSSTTTAEVNNVTTGDADATDAPLCLSCHDGTNLTGNLTNPPGLPGAQPTISNGPISAGADIDLDLSNDHPIGFDYAVAQGLDSELDTKANAESDLGAGALSFGGGNDMWCSSCHDVHGIAGVESFLRISNAGSNLCLACHIK